MARKSHQSYGTSGPAMDEAQAHSHGLVNPTDTMNSDGRRWSSGALSDAMGSSVDFPHVSHAICKLFHSKTRTRN